MDKLHFNILFEIWKYLNFKEINNFRISSKKLLKRVEDVMIILSEREGNRILLSSNKINRNPFVEYEDPKFVLQNKSWYDFLISQIKLRWMIKK